ncbi:glycosyltransferase [Sphingobacterium faecium]|uniref:glycosyltransferase family 4 protein n=1 Tax=Sphingobacterium faecium TaxID=34087 RepID=UPI001291B727|nr:glycosyltransferase family 1 protein [Sphingobacterium faecium]MQP28335.1 glycosyltransferase [Sphingobacterium faecium]
MFKVGFDAKRFFNNQTGLGNYSRDLIRILRTYFPEETYLLYTPQLGKQDYNQLVPNQMVRQASGFINRTFKSYWRGNRIVEDLKRDKIDIFHGLSGEIPVGLQETSIKSVVTIHDLIFIRYPELYKKIDRTVYYKKFKYACDHADQIVAISEQTKRDICEFFHISENKVKVIYQGCHQSFKSIKTEEEKNDFMIKLGLPKDFILNVGTIESRKNALSIVKAIVDKDIPLVIVGKPTAYTKEIHEFVALNGMQNRVIFLHGLSMQELSILYSIAKIFVYPSIFEGFGIPIIEALYSGTPVITTDSGVFPEAGGPSSYYVNPQDIDQLSDAIDTILNSSVLQKEMSKKGLEYAQQFNDDTLANQWMNLYLEMHGESN